MAFRNDISKALLGGGGGGGRATPSSSAHCMSTGRTQAGPIATPTGVVVMGTGNAIGGTMPSTTLLRATEKTSRASWSVTSGSAGGGTNYSGTHTSSVTGATTSGPGTSLVILGAGGASQSLQQTGAGIGNEQAVIFRQQRTPVGFLLNKAIEMLKQHPSRQLHVKELEKLLIQQGFGDLHAFFQTNSDFLRVLSSNERVAFNPVHRTLCFVNPYELINSPRALRAKIIFDGGTTGLRVDMELLSACSGAGEHIHALLSQRQVRAVRTTNNHMRGRLKCIRLGTGSNTTNMSPSCDLYASRKCSSCMRNLQGLILYPLGDEELESARLALDKEIKQLWDEVTLPPLEDIVRQSCALLDLPRPGVGGLGGEKTAVKRRGDPKKAPRHRNKFRRIQNTHLFTAEELRAFANGGSLQ